MGKLTPETKYLRVRLADSETSRHCQLLCGNVLEHELFHWSALKGIWGIFKIFTLYFIFSID